MKEDTMSNNNMSPSKQHEAQAKKILARRATGKTNDKPAVKEVEQDEVLNVPDNTSSTVNDGDGVPDNNNTATEEVTSYEGLSRKDLRAKCDEEGVKFKKKDTIEILIAKLEA